MKSKSKFKNLEEIALLAEGEKEFGAYLDEIDLKELIDLLSEFNQAERKNHIKDGYLELIHGISYDYDGCNTVKSLKELIDELDDLAIKGLKNDDKTIMYWTAVDFKKRKRKG